MRITLGMLTNRVRVDLMHNADLLMDAQARGSSGKRIQRPSDDVPGVGRAISLRASLAAVDQYNRNSGIAKNLLSVTNDTLNTIVNKLQDVRRHTLQAASHSNNQEALDAISAQLDQIAVELKSTANTKYLGRYIFSGSDSASEAVVDNPGLTPPCLFQGNSEAFNIQIAPGTYIPANLTADQVFNMDGAVRPDIADVFAVIQSISDSVAAGDATGLSAQIADIDFHLNNASAMRSQIGGRINRLEAANSALADQRLKIMDLLSQTEDADLAETMVDLRTRENVYMAAIDTASRILQMSLTNTWK